MTHLTSINNLLTLKKNYSTINIDEEINSLFVKTYSDEATPAASDKRKIVVTENLNVYVDMSDAFIITKDILKNIYETLCSTFALKDKNKKYKIKVILVSPASKITYLEEKDKRTLQTFIEETNAFKSKAQELSTFPNYSRIKSHINFISSHLSLWNTRLRFTDNVNKIPSLIIKKVSEIVNLFKEKEGADYDISIDVNSKKIFKLDLKNIDEKSIIILKETNKNKDMPDHQTFKKEVEEAINHLKFTKATKEEAKAKAIEIAQTKQNKIAHSLVNQNKKRSKNRLNIK